MRVLLDCLFDAAANLTTSDREREELALARRAALSLLVLSDLDDRERVVRVLEDLGTWAAIADEIADHLLRPFPRSRRQKDNQATEQAGPFYVD